MDFPFVAKIHYLVIKKVPSNMAKGNLFLKDFKIKSPYFSEWVLEVHQHVNRIPNFFKNSICVIAKFWLNPLVADHHFW
jgi:hypothetical protein